MITLDLNGVWQMRRLPDGQWLQAQVPGSIYADLLGSGLMDDPFYRDNEDAALSLSGFDYEYRRSFTVAPELLDAQRIALVCRGLDTIADVEINGSWLARAENMHRTYEFDVTPLLHPGDNEILIRFTSPVRFAREEQQRRPLWGVGQAVTGFSHLRKGHSMFGWDWGPQLPDMGIWRSIGLEFYQEARLEDIRWEQKHDQGAVTLSGRIGYQWLAEEQADSPPVSVQVQILAPDGSLLYEECRTLPPSENCVSVAATITEPLLWWPNGYGGQPLYSARVLLLRDGAVLDGRSFSLGLRTVELRREKDGWGESFCFRVNGVDIFAQGANYIPEDNLLSRYSYERTEQLIKDCIAANFNCIRVWGGGIYPDEYFYDLCDRCGLLVWQDFMFACAVYDLRDDFAENIRQEAIGQVKRLRHRACLALWCGNNEIEQALDSWSSVIQTPTQKAEYLKQFEILLADVVRSLDPERTYWPSSPSSGGGFDAPNDENRGDVHYWEVWHGLKPFEAYRKYHFRFCSEFGFQSFPSPKTVRSFTLPEDRNIFSRIMEKHQKNGAANGKIMFYLAEHFKYPRSTDALLLVSQVLQAEAIRYGVEHWRRHRGRCMGSIYWQLNDCWPVASWSSIDYYGRWKALHYSARRFYAPVLLSACEDGLRADLYVTNETRGPFAGTVVWRLLDRDGQVLRKGEAQAAMAPLSAGCICKLDFSGELGGEQAELARRAYLEYSLILPETGETRSRGTLLFSKAKHFEFADPALQLSVEETAEAYEIAVKARSFAKYVTLDLTEADGVFSDNFFDLSAGESRIIELPKERLSRPLALEELRQQLQAQSLYDWS
ncbi:glycoside hydrolase family 2 protein [Paenibacillus sp. YN15]|nr:glycoside hydrolase family 2 protein [Paenibacillus sp. YN15]